MTICFFGTYNYNYARTAALREGLHANDVTLIEVNVDLPNVRMELPEDFTLRKSLWRFYRKAKAIASLATRYTQVKQADGIVVLHPGHLDLPLAWLFAKLSSKPLVFDSAVSPYDTMFIGRSIAERSSLKAKLVKVGETLVLKLPTYVFTDTKQMADFISETFDVSQNKMRVVPLGANDKVYLPAKNAKSSNNPIEILFFGLYSELHGVFTILEAIKQLVKRDDIHFTLLGAGHLQDDMMQYAKKNHLDHVTFIGFMPEPELVKRIQAADILLGVFSKNPVFERAMPNKVIAALACRKPLITANLQPVRQYLTNGTDALLVAPEDARALAQAVKKLADNAQLRVSVAEHGYIVYQKHFSPREVGKALIDIIS